MFAQTPELLHADVLFTSQRTAADDGYGFTDSYGVGEAAMVA